MLLLVWICLSSKDKKLTNPFKLYVSADEKPKTFGTYHTPKTEFENNHHFFEYSFEEDDIVELLSALKPTIIISALRGTFPSQLLAHRHIYHYLKQQENSKIIFL